MFNGTRAGLMSAGRLASTDAGLPPLRNHWRSPCRSPTRSLPGSSSSAEEHTKYKNEIIIVDNSNKSNKLNPKKYMNSMKMSHLGD